MDKDKTKLQLIKRIGENNLFILKYVFKFTPGYLINTCIITIASAVVVFFEHVYCIKYLTDVIQYGQSFRKVIIYIAAISTAVLLKIIYNTYFNHITQPISQEKLNKLIRMDLYERAVKLDLACYDDPNFYNDFVWSTSEVANRVNQTVDYVKRCFDNLTWIVTSGTLILMLDKIGLLFVAVSFLGTTITSFAMNKLQLKMEMELKPKLRKLSYISRVFYLTDYAKEIRLNDVHRMLKADYEKTNNEMKEVIDRHSKKQVLYGFLNEYIFNSFILDGVYMLYLLYIAAVKASISYGSTIALVNCVSNVKHCLRDIAMLVPELQKNSLYIEKIRTIMEYQSAIKSPVNVKPVPEQSASLELNNVTFCYNKSNDPVLKNVSMKVNPGEKIALVGYNGAGKTTLIKLIMRLYDVSQGEIRLNGTPISDYDLESYRSLYGAVFQDYQIFAFDIAQNVKMDLISKEDEDMIREALDNSGFFEKLWALELGLHTPLTKGFDEKGVNLSGGEAQKVSLARVFYKHCPIIILDEPSSALDPISEYHLNEAMMKAAEHKTVIFISHRLSSTRMADKIYMLEKGEIIEEGSHAELMAKDGKYAQMFNLQAENYRMFA